MGELSGKSAVVSGATSGIGRTQAIMLAAEGADVVCIGRNPDRMDEVIGTIKNAGGTAIPCVGDISQAETCRKAAALAVEHFGKIDICCATAGVFDSFVPSLEQTEEKWDFYMNTNVKGVFLLSNAVLADMVKHENGSIIIMSSIAGLTGNSGGAAYTTTKHAVVGYTRQLCIDYAAKGIRANAICAGSVLSSILEGIFTEFPEEREIVLEAIPAKRIGKPEDIGHLTVYLASDKAAWINGSIISADGGRSAFG
ncbi:MAG: SDR family oxidoreductase [Clostridiales Family XIII bacterium]|jgi:3-oxoacyl-[acyl-carrier protein] reductase|nr:SDR family oxidoreductase [Clostridiales Family XIII bacterium]